jgi:hypothetical protein
LDEEVFRILRKHNAAQVSVSSQGMPMNLAVTAYFNNDANVRAPARIRLSIARVAHIYWV